MTIVHEGCRYVPAQMGDVQTIFYENVSETEYLVNLLDGNCLFPLFLAVPMPVFSRGAGV